MFSLIVLFASAAFVQIAEGQIKCYSGAFSEPQNADDLATYSNCKFCSYRETQYNGELIEVYYGCADQCEAYDKNGQKLECCEEDLCNAKGGSGGEAPKKEKPSREMPMPPEEKPDDEIMPEKIPSEEKPAGEMPSVEKPPMDQPTENESSGGPSASKLPSISDVADEAADEDEY